MHKLSSRCNIFLAWTRARLSSRLPRANQTMATQRIDATIKKIMLPLTSERSKREAGRIVQRNQLVNLAELYRGIGLDEKFSMLRLLVEEFGWDSNEVLQQCQTVTELSQSQRDESAILQTETRLRNALKPGYHVLFTQLGTLKDGVKLLIDMRYDAILACRNKQLTPIQIQGLRNLSDDIGEILSMWFSVGLLQLSQMTWTTPAAVLEKLAEYEAVHTVRNWMDLKHRLGPNRRCYAFFHGNMPEEPLIVLHVALTKSISDKITDILDYKTKDGPTEKAATCAIFYSITSTQKGLQGIELGPYLIQSVVESLRSELPHLTTFSSLSPIPGFRKWLLSEFGRGLRVHKFINNQDLQSLSKAHVLIDHNGDDDSLIQHVAKNLHLLNQIPDLGLCVKSTLLKLCAFYICKVKRRNYALDAVANFHLKNGAVAWRLNWMADTSLAGLQKSCGIMINYRYYLEDMAKNSADYISNYTVSISKEVSALVEENSSKL